MCKSSFFFYRDVPYLALGSKNVTVVVVATAENEALEDLSCYTEDRFQFAGEMARVFLEQIFKLREDQRMAMIRYVAKNSATLCGESISPMHQHIQSYHNSYCSACRGAIGLLHLLFYPESAFLFDFMWKV